MPATRYGLDGRWPRRGGAEVASQTAGARAWRVRPACRAAASHRPALDPRSAARLHRVARRAAKGQPKVL
eukprot:scaffold66508_cov69-Phaeocystis_antarctica.AAC.2